jgi:hypothetical protein
MHHRPLEMQRASLTVRTLPRQGFSRVSLRGLRSYRQRTTRRPRVVASQQLSSLVAFAPGSLAVVIPVERPSQKYESLSSEPLHWVAVGWLAPADANVAGITSPIGVRSSETLQVGYAMRTLHQGAKRADPLGPASERG